jgi:antitoxin FitA
MHAMPLLYSMNKSITIRDVPARVRDELAARAARTGRSLQEYLRLQLIELASRPDLEEWVAAVRERKALYGSAVTREQILAHRDADRR